MSKLLPLLLVASFRDASSCDCETLSFTATGWTGTIKTKEGLYTKMPGVMQNGRPVWSRQAVDIDGIVVDVDGDYYVYYAGPLPSGTYEWSVGSDYNSVNRAVGEVDLTAACPEDVSFMNWGVWADGERWEMNSNLDFGLECVVMGTSTGGASPSPPYTFPSTGGASTGGMATTVECTADGITQKIFLTNDCSDTPMTASVPFDQCVNLDEGSSKPVSCGDEAVFERFTSDDCTGAVATRQKLKTDKCIKGDCDSADCGATIEELGALVGGALIAAIVVPILAVLICGGILLGVCIWCCCCKDKKKPPAADPSSGVEIKTSV